MSGSTWAALIADPRELDPQVRYLYLMDGMVRGRGLFRISWAEGAVGRLAAFISRLPRPGTTPVSLTIVPDGEGVWWFRTFGRVPLVSFQQVRNGTVHEAIGPLLFTYRLEVRDGGIDYRPRATRLMIGDRSVRLPRPFAPRVEVRIEGGNDADSTFTRFSVDVPLLGRIFDCEGTLWKEAS